MTWAWTRNVSPRCATAPTRIGRSSGKGSRAGLTPSSGPPDRLGLGREVERMTGLTELGDAENVEHRERRPDGLAPPQETTMIAPGRHRQIGLGPHPEEPVVVLFPDRLG